MIWLQAIRWSLCALLLTFSLGQAEQSDQNEHQPTTAVAVPDDSKQATSTNSSGAGTSPTAKTGGDPERDVSVNPNKFARNFLSDQKIIWTFPARLVKGSDWLPTLAVTAATTALVMGVDPYEGRYFRRHASTFDDFNNALSETRTTSATLLIPGSLAAGGYIFKNKYLAHSGLLALEAWVDVDILDEAIRVTARRERPLDIAPNGNYRDTWFKAGGNPLTAAGGFPSGHTGWAFAVATVIARRYPQHGWVRFVAYGLAAVDMFSRISSSNHFVSDSFFGTALGYSVGRFVVLRQ